MKYLLLLCMFIFTGCVSSISFLDKQTCDLAKEKREKLSPKTADIEWKNDRCFTKDTIFLSCDLKQEKIVRFPELGEIVANCGGTLSDGNEDSYYVKENIENEKYQQCIKSYGFNDGFYESVDGYDTKYVNMKKGYIDRYSPKEKMEILCTSNKDIKEHIHELTKYRMFPEYTVLKSLIAYRYQIKEIEEILNREIFFNPLREETVIVYDRKLGGSSDYMYGNYSFMKYCIEENDLELVKLVVKYLSKEQIQSEYMKKMLEFSKHEKKDKITSYLEELLKN